MTEAATSLQGATEEEPVDQRGKAGRSVKRDYEAGNGNHLPPVFALTSYHDQAIRKKSAVPVAPVIGPRLRASRRPSGELWENKQAAKIG